MEAAGCEVAGPGRLVVTTARSERRFEIKAGERARFDTNGRIVNCQDLPPLSEAAGREEER